MSDVKRTTAYAAAVPARQAAPFGAGSSRDYTLLGRQSRDLIDPWHLGRRPTAAAARERPFPGLALGAIVPGPPLGLTTLCVPSGVCDGPPPVALRDSSRNAGWAINQLTSVTDHISARISHQADLGAQIMSANSTHWLHRARLLYEQPVLFGSWPTLAKQIDPRFPIPVRDPG